MLYEITVKVLRWRQDAVTEKRIVLADDVAQAEEYAQNWYSDDTEGDNGYGEFFAIPGLGVAWKVERIKPVHNFMVEDIRDNEHDLAVVYYSVAGPGRYETEEDYER